MIYTGNQLTSIRKANTPFDTSAALAFILVYSVCPTDSWQSVYDFPLSEFIFSLFFSVLRANFKLTLRRVEVVETNTFCRPAAANTLIFVQ